MYTLRALKENYRPNFASHTGAFDAVWSLAEALKLTEEMRVNNKTTEKCNLTELPGELVPLNEFEYSNAYMGCVIKSSLETVNFTGVTVSYITHSCTVCLTLEKCEVFTLCCVYINMHTHTHWRMVLIEKTLDLGHIRKGHLKRSLTLSS